MTLESSEQHSWMLNLLRSRPPAPAMRQDPPPPPERYWPAPERPIPVPGAEIISRHPALTGSFAHLPEMKIGRSPRSSRRGRQGRIPSRKTNRVLRAASTIEFDNILDCEMDGRFFGFVEQPIWLRFPMDGAALKHRPDGYVLFNGRVEFHEAKYEKEAKENEARWKAIASALNGMGFGYRVRTELEIRREPRFSTVWRIYEDRLAPLPEWQVLETLNAHLQLERFITLNEAIKTWGFRQDQVHALIRRGFFNATLDAPLVDHSRLTRGWASFENLRRTEEL